VTESTRVKSKLILSFAGDAKEGGQSVFTISIAAHNLRAFKKAGLDPLSWKCGHLRVRGWIVGGGESPEMTVTDPYQIELLDQASSLTGS
jgi:hypothetical protein